LTESDGPFINIGARRVVPPDIQIVEYALAEIWAMAPSTVRSQIAQNFHQLMKPLKKTPLSENV
jgi:Tat protein secretion system quality control protein TatD with DNase activity